MSDRYESNELKISSEFAHNLLRLTQPWILRTGCTIRLPETKRSRKNRLLLLIDY